MSYTAKQSRTNFSLFALLVIRWRRHFAWWWISWWQDHLVARWVILVWDVTTKSDTKEITLLYDHKSYRSWVSTGCVTKYFLLEPKARVYKLIIHTTKAAVKSNPEFHIFIHILHLLRVYYELAMWSAPRWLDSSVGRALHRYRRGHGLESRSGLNCFFRL